MPQDNTSVTCDIGCCQRRNMLRPYFGTARRRQGAPPADGVVPNSSRRGARLAASLAKKSMYSSWLKNAFT